MLFEMRAAYDRSPPTNRPETTPEDACPTYHAFYDGLSDFEQDLHQHSHLENNILFPRAIDLEKASA